MNPKYIQTFASLCLLLMLLAQAQALKVNTRNNKVFPISNNDENTIRHSPYSLTENLNQQKSNWSLPETFNWVGCKLFNSCIEQDQPIPKNEIRTED